MKLRYFVYIALVLLVTGVWTTRYLKYKQPYYMIAGVQEAHAVTIDLVNGDQPIVLKGEEAERFLMLWSNMGSGDYYQYLCHDGAFKITFHYPYGCTNVVPSLCLSCCNINLNDGNYLGIDLHDEIGVDLHMLFREYYPELFEGSLNKIAFDKSLEWAVDGFIKRKYLVYLQQMAPEYLEQLKYEFSSSTSFKDEIEGPVNEETLETIFDETPSRALLSELHRLYEVCEMYEVINEAYYSGVKDILDENRGVLNALDRLVAQNNGKLTPVVKSLMVSYHRLYELYEKAP